MEAHWVPKQRAKGLKAIGTAMRTGGGPGRAQNAAKTRPAPGQEYTVLDIPGAPPLRFGPSKARFVGNYAKNTVQKDLTGSGTLYTK